MTQTLTANTARSNLSTALVAGLNQPYTPKQFPKLVFGETVDANLYLVDDSGTYDTRSGLAGYAPRVVVTLDDQTPQGGTFTVSDGTATTTALDWDASATEIETALNLLNTSTGPFGDTVTVEKFGNGAFSVLFDSLGAQTILTVNTAYTLPTSTAGILPIVEGGATAREEQIIRIFASPLLFADGGASITSGWRVTLDANNANFLRAVAKEQGDLSANYSIEIVSPTSTIDVVARGPVILSQSTFDVAALNGIAYPNIPTLDGPYINERLDITGLDGSTITDLDSIATLTLDLNYTVLTGVTVGASVPGKTWALESGTDANNPAGGVVRPDDYATTTNEKVWKVQQ